MRTIKKTSRFKKDYKREKGSGRHKDLETLLREAIELLLVDAPLPLNKFDHDLSGDWKDFRECHIKPDLLLIYRKPDAESLELIRLASHFWAD
ncbi:MAG TPA: type II toxin-antitoxin system YafQ family toxin [Candidatus Melainabacteria bacterium]|nr:type II toxin-antitoxin system YafQ family toxin [Candidatus Melainabacteria bacterium]